MSLLPPDVLRLARLHRARQQQLAAIAVRQVRRRWGLLDPANIAATWQAIAGAVSRLVAGYQAEAARGADTYVAAALSLAGATPDPAGQVVTSAMAGVASDGRDLAGLLGYPAFEVSAFVDQGMEADQALAIGGRHLDRMVQTQVQDAARVATGVAIVNDRKTRGWIRMLTPPSCSRCVILAGQWYAYNKGFERHPNCDCIHVPAAEVIKPESPLAVFNAMSDDELKRAGWSAADVRAIREDGADLYQVTNAHRDLRSVTIAGQQLKVTGQGATRRGLAGKRLGAGGKRQAVRLTPESIYSESERLGWSRDETIRQLQRHGYILSAPRRRAAAEPALTFADRLNGAAHDQSALSAARAGVGRHSAGMVQVTRAQQYALRDYISSYFYAINGQLRRDDVGAIVERRVARIDEVMAKAALPRDVVVWRGIAHAGRLFGDRLAGNMTGAEWVEKAYTSTSASRRVAAGFTYHEDQVLMRVLVPRAVQAVKLSEMDGQAELLLQRGLRFRVVADRGVSPEGYRLLDVEVIR